MELEYDIVRRNGTQYTVPQSEMFHLFGLTLNGYCGVSPMTFARETIGQVRARDRQVAGTFRNGARPSGAVAMPDGKKLSDQARSEEHTSELQSLMRISYAVFCLKTKQKQQDNTCTQP